MILSFSLLAAAIMQPAAPDWRALSSTAERQLSWDANGVTRDGETTTVRLRFVQLPARTGANAYAISRVEIRCAADQVRVAETVNYAADGTAGRVDSEALPFEAIPPTSIIATVRDHVCTGANAAR